MKLNPLASFAAGILLATTVSSAAYFTVESEASNRPASSPVSKEQAQKEKSEEEMIADLESEGYVVQTLDEFDQSIEEAKAAGQREIADKETKEESKSKKKVINRVLINVTDGMTSIDVGRMLEKAKIVDNAFKFTKEVEKKGVENHLRPGMYEVDSEMTREEVISTIFK